MREKKKTKTMCILENILFWKLTNISHDPKVWLHNKTTFHSASSFMDLWPRLTLTLT